MPAPVRSQPVVPLEQPAQFLSRGRKDAPILVITDVPSHEGFKARRIMPDLYRDVFEFYMTTNGIDMEDVQFLAPAPPFPPGISESKKEQNEWLKKHHAAFLHTCSKRKFKMLLPFGASAAQQVLGKPVKITRVRGVASFPPSFPGVPMVAIMSPGQVVRQPHHELSFKADLEMVRQLHKADYDSSNLQFDVGQNYRWVNYDGLMEHTQQAIAKLEPGEPLACSMDTETVGGKQYEGAKPIMAQVSYDMGDGVAIPLTVNLCARVLASKFNVYKEFITYTPEGKANRERRQVPVIEYDPNDPDKVTNLIINAPKIWADCLTKAAKIVPKNWKAFKELMEGEVHPIIFTGQNFKYDIHVCRNAGVYIDTDNWEHDTMQLAFVMSENLQSKDLASITKIWIPPLSGYSDEFEASVNYAKMDQVEHDKIMHYGVADTDTCFRLTRRLVPEAMQDEKHYNCYERVQMPALRMFAHVEARGIQVDMDNLKNFSEALIKAEEELYESMIEQIPGTIKLKHYQEKNKNRKGLNFSRDALVKDYLFTHELGLQLEPLLFTPGGEPSLSTKTHLTYFEHQAWVLDYIEWQKITKLLSTYIGNEEDRTGLYQYIPPGGCSIHPSYLLHGTVTGRTSSRDPNGQNIPKHGKLAIAYRRNFRPRKGYSFIEVDLSQAELRIAAWMAREKNMLRIYREGGDIHINTGAAIAGIAVDKFKKGQKDDRLLNTCANEWGGAKNFLNSLSEDEASTFTVAKYMKALRQRAKAVNFGFLYGMGWKKFAAYAKSTYKVDVTDEEAQHMRDVFFQLYPRLRDWHAEQREFVRQHGFVRAVHGAKRHLEDIYSVDEKIRGATERQAINSPVQRFASDYALMGASRLFRDLKFWNNDDAHLVAFIHDAVILEVKKGKEKEYASYIKWYMESTPLEEWFGIKAPLPLLADITYAPDNLGETHEWHDTVAKKPNWFTSDSDDFTPPPRLKQKARPPVQFMRHATPNLRGDEPAPVAPVVNLRGDDSEHVFKNDRVPLVNLRE